MRSQTDESNETMVVWQRQSISFSSPVNKIERKTEMNNERSYDRYFKNEKKRLK